MYALSSFTLLSLGRERQVDFLLNLLGQMEFSIKLHTIKSGLPIVYIEGTQLKIPH